MFRVQPRGRSPIRLTPRTGPGLSRFFDPAGRLHWSPALRAGLLRILCMVGLLVLTHPVFAQVSVRTLGGGRTAAKGPDAGFSDGNTLQTSQFNTPAGIDTDGAGQLYVADRKNGAVRKLDISANRSLTLLSGLDQPVDVALNTDRDLFILTQGDGQIRRMDRFGNVRTFSARFRSPTALAVGGDKTVFITEALGSIVQFNTETGVTAEIRSGLNRPSGIALLNSGLLAVSEKANHRILFIDPANGRVVSQVASGMAGFRDGSIANAQFNEPEHVAKTPNGSLLVADTRNHRVRLITTDGTVSTVYGKDPTLWEGPECLTCMPIILPGWLDGSREIAEAREPVGVAVAPDGKGYVTESYYHLIREISGLDVGAGTGDGSDNSSLEVLPPVFSPESGYFPLGTLITVQNPNTNAFFSSAIYYTTDGSAPSTNSTRLILHDNVGRIIWRNSMRDLTSLRLVAFIGSRPSVIVRGKTSPRNEIGITRDISAGIGSTIVVPISVNLRPADALKSLQFRVEVTPENAATPPIPEAFQPLTVSTNDFIAVATASEASQGPARFNAASYSFGATRGLAITFIGANANLSLKNFGVAAMLAIPIPPTAQLGSRYKLDVVQASGTSDGSEAGIDLLPMPSRWIITDQAGYRVGDSSPASWYNAESETGPTAPLGFGDERLDNADVNNVFLASLGERVPYLFTDLFDAMDAYPEDTESAVGGDGLIRFLDWQVVLERSLGFDPNPWRRVWTGNGFKEPQRTQPPPPPDRPSVKLADSPGNIWYRQALISAGSISQAPRGSQVELPVFTSVATGARLAGLAFRVMITPQNGAPSLPQSPEFVASPGLNPPVQTPISPHILLCGWPLVPSPSFEPALQGTRRIGSLRISIPPTAQSGNAYRISFSNADGAPNLKTEYQLETQSGFIWVETEKTSSLRIISDDWAARFFGNDTENAQADADPDRDDVPNWAEYVAGTDPTRAESRLRFASVDRQASSDQVLLRWLSAPGKTYSVEAASDLKQLKWTPLASGIAGTGRVVEHAVNAPEAGSRFFRLQVEGPQLPLD